MKGQIHTEWVISLGIFLLYLLGMIIFIKPGYVSYYGEKDLINIIEDGFKEKFYWTVKKVPLFVDECNCPPDGSECSITFSLKASGWNVNGTGIYGPVFDGNKVPPDGTVFWFGFSTSDKDKEFFIEDMSEGCDGTTKEYRVGTVENVYGIDRKVSSLIYEKLKQDLNYPENKDFILKLNDKVVKNKDPPQGVNLYVKEWEDFYVDRDGNRESVRVSITVW